MRMKLRSAGLIAVAFLVGASAALAFTAPLGGDYPGGTCNGTCDFAGPPIEALVHGDISRFFDVQPLMGSFSLLLRAPFAAVASVLDGGTLWEYRLGAFPCLLALALLAGWLWQLMGRRRQPLVARAAVVALCLASPMTFKTLYWGHPEELLGAALCVGALILATRGRSFAAGLLLGLAIATKQWAVLALLPILLSARQDRLRLTVVAAVAAVVFIGPMFASDPGHFLHTQTAAAATQGNRGMTPTNIWWPYAHVISRHPTGDGHVALGYGLSTRLNDLTHPLVVLGAIALPLLYWRRRADRRPEDALALLALIFLLRCVLDPLTFSYHHAPFLIALVAYEGVRRRGLPVLGILAAVMLWLTASVVAPGGDPYLLNRFYVAWTLPLAGYLVLTLFFPAQASWLDRRLRLARPLDAATA
jgi:Glycosyltransferase family 87